MRDESTRPSGIVATPCTAGGDPFDVFGGCRSGDEGRSKVCAFPPIGKEKARVGVKSFRPCFDPVVADDGPAVSGCRLLRRARESNFALLSKVLLLSAFLSSRVRSASFADARGGVRRRVGCGSGRPFRARAGRPRREIFSRGLLTVKKSVIRFRPADLACQESEQNRHPVAKHNQNIRLESVDGGVGFASLGEMQEHPRIRYPPGCMGQVFPYPSRRA